MTELESDWMKETNDMAMNVAEWNSMRIHAKIFVLKLRMKR